MARTYKRDSRGRFAGGGGSGGGKKGRPAGPSGGKVGSSAQQKKNAAAQADRSKRFSSKSTKGRDAKAIWKEDSRAFRVADKRFRSTPNQYTAAPRRHADSQLHKTTLLLQGKTKELKKYVESERRTQKRDAQFAAQRAVHLGREKASKTIRGKLAAVKRLVTGSKRKRR